MRQKISLSKRTVETLVPRDKAYLIFDTTLSGFGLRVMPSGKRFFLVQYRKRGRSQRVVLGQYGPLTAEIAKREAQRILGEVRGAGGDPAAQRDADRQALTMEELGQRFLAEHVATRCKPTTQAEYRRSIMLVVIPFCGKERANRITSADIAELHGKMAATPYQANRTLGVLSKMMNLAEVWGVRPKHSNPCEDVQKYPEYKRERFLSSAEIKRLGQALSEAEQSNPKLIYTVAALRLLLLTGCRLSEIQTLRWSYVDLDQHVLRLPESKTGAKNVYIGPVVAKLLAELPRLEDNPFVIVGKLPRAHVTDIQHPWRRIRKAAGLSGVRIHDLRHTFASSGLLEGQGLPMIGKLLGHTQVQTTARYAHLAADPIKEAARLISLRLAGPLLDLSELEVTTTSTEEGEDHSYLSLVR